MTYNGNSNRSLNWTNWWHCFWIRWIAFWKKKAKKQRGLDEVHDHIWQKARSYSWYAILIAIYFLFFLYFFGLHLNTLAVLSIIILVHLLSWAIIGVYLLLIVYTDGKTDKKTYTF